MLQCVAVCHMPWPLLKEGCELALHHTQQIILRLHRRSFLVWYTRAAIAHFTCTCARAQCIRVFTQNRHEYLHTPRCSQKRQCAQLLGLVCMYMCVSVYLYLYLYSIMYIHVCIFHIYIYISLSLSLYIYLFMYISTYNTYI